MTASHWIAGSGVGLTWTAAFGTEFTTTALPINDAIASSVVITNGTALDMFCDFSVHIAAMTTTGAPFLGVYLYPLNQDGSTYGDGRFATAAAGPPASNYSVGSIALPVVTTTATNGSLTQIVIPPGSFKFVIFNGTGTNSTPASGNTSSYRTYNISMT